jgi:hypothetical protein
VPLAHAAPALAALNLRVLHTALYFVLAEMDPCDRVALVTLDWGAGGAVRKTPFLSPART